MELDLSKPLVAGFPILRQGFPTIWVQFQYEMLANFCYLCDSLRHVKLACPEKDLISESSGFDYRLRAESFNLRHFAFFRVITQPKPYLALVKGKYVLGEPSESSHSRNPHRPPMSSRNVPQFALPDPPVIHSADLLVECWSMEFRLLWLAPLVVLWFLGVTLLGLMHSILPTKSYQPICLCHLPPSCGVRDGYVEPIVSSS